MRRWLKWAGTGLTVLVVGVAILLGVAWHVSEKTLARVYTIQDPPLIVSTDAAALARGKHLFATRGCAECHGPQGAGQVLFDAPGVMRIAPPNLTLSLRNPAYTNEALAAAIRHGVRPDGKALRIMPARDYADLDDADLAALVAYVRALPSTDHDPGATVVRPIGRALYLLGMFDLAPAESLDHAPRTRQAPPPAITPAYGQYVAQACSGCHGRDFAGGIVIEPGKPASANLTPHAIGLAHWSEADFLQAMRTGRRPDGRQLDPLMPWSAFRQMDEVELRALWKYLSTLPPRAGNS